MAGTGGFRPGAGRKIGTVTLATQTARKRFVRRFEKIQDKLFDAAQDLAFGVLIYEGNDKLGKPRVYRRPPELKAVIELLQQGIGRAPQTIDLSADVSNRTFVIKRAGDNDEVASPVQDEEMLDSVAEAADEDDGDEE